MKRFYPLLLLFFTLAACAFAQSPSISVSTQPEVCVNTPVKVNANVSGLFSQSNLFKVRLRRNNLSDYVEIPATFENQQFTFTVPRDRVELRQSYEIQIVASSPATVSNWASYITFHAKDRLILANTKTDTVNKYREFGLLFQTHSSSSGIATLMDSSKIWFDALVNPEQLNSMVKYRYPTLPTVVAFPNPTREFVTLNFAKSGKYNVYLYDIAGKLLASYRTSEEALRLDLRKYPASILILNVESGQKKSTFRIIRQ